MCSAKTVKRILDRKIFIGWILEFSLLFYMNVNADAVYLYISLYACLSRMIQKITLDEVWFILISGEFGCGYTLKLYEKMRNISLMMAYSVDYIEQTTGKQMVYSNV